MRLFERIYRCMYCGSEMTCQQHMGNPFCDGCLPERMKKAEEEAGPGHWEPIEHTGGLYVRWAKDEPEDRPHDS